MTGEEARELGGEPEGAAAASQEAPCWRLRLVGRSGAESLTCPLTCRAGDAIEVFEGGCVVEDGEYDFALIGRGAGVGACMTVWVDGREVELGQVAPVELPAGSADAGLRLWSFGPAAGENPFRLAWGVVRIDVEVEFDDGGTLGLSTPDVACLTHNTDRARQIEAMVRELTAGSGPSSAALSWMLADGAQPGVRAAAGSGEGPVVMGTAQAHLAGVSRALEVFEASLDAVRTQAPGRAVQASRLVSAGAARRFGRFEATWLARHPEELRPSACGPVRSHGVALAPARLMVEQTQRSTDTYENGVLLGFLRWAEQDLRALDDELRQRAGRVAAVADKLAGCGGTDMELPAVAMLRRETARLRGLSGQAGALCRRAVRLRRVYGDLMPQARPVDVRRGLRKTKVFRETPLFARLWHAMEEALDCSADQTGAYEALALGLLRLDALYEMYALFRLLDWLACNGFSPDPAFARPIKRVHYTLDSAHYRDQALVASSYALARADGTRIKLLYQPVVYGDAREENGVTLHRTTRPCFPDGKPGTRDSYYTPDYLLCVQDALGKRQYVLDAKYAWGPSLLQGRASLSSRISWSGGIFQCCMVKYLLETVDSATGRAPDGMWLLAPSCSEELWAYQNSGWAQAGAPARCSGIAEAGPSTPCLDAFFARLGLEPLEHAVQALPAGEPMEEGEREGEAEQAVQAGESALLSAPEAVSDDQGAASDSSGPAGEASASSAQGEAAAAVPAVFEVESAVPEAVPEPGIVPTSDPNLGFPSGSEPNPGPEFSPGSELGGADGDATPEPPSSSADKADGDAAAAEFVPRPSKPELDQADGGATVVEPALGPSDSESATGPSSSAARSARKKANRAKRKAEQGGRAKQPATRAAAALDAQGALELLLRIPERSRLHNPVYVRRMFGLDYALCRADKPQGAAARLYAGPVELDGRQVYVRCSYTPAERNRLERTLRRLERSHS